MNNFLLDRKKEPSSASVTKLIFIIQIYYEKRSSILNSNHKKYTPFAWTLRLRYSLIEWVLSLKISWK